MYLRTLSLINSKTKFNYLQLTGEYEIREIGNKGHVATYVEAICECGIIKMYHFGHVKRGKIKSCGCQKAKLTIKNNTKHGMSLSKIYLVWSSMNKRCTNSNDKRFHRYGGRGISVEWKTFEDFYNDMMPTYKEGLQIDRINNDGNYSKNNCKWVTNIENAQHTCRTHKLYIDGKLLSLAGFCRALTLQYNSLKAKLNKGKITIEEIQAMYKS